MTAYVVLLRAINVLGSGKLPMAQLKTICENAGFRSVRTYIASGNVVFQSPQKEAQVRALLQPPIAAVLGKPAGIFVRTAEEMAAVHAANPFPDKPADRTVAFFLNEPPPPDAHLNVSNNAGEQLRLGLREIYVHYPDGIGQSRIKIPAALPGTARNMNTIAKLAELAAAL